jgi:hypothetical protein
MYQPRFLVEALHRSFLAFLLMVADRELNAPEAIETQQQQQQLAVSIFYY